MANLNWYGSNSFFRANAVQLTWNTGPPPYTFTPANPPIDSGPYGAYISADDGWTERECPTCYEVHDRALRFEYIPRSGGAAVVDDPTSNAQDNGWNLVSVYSRDNGESDVWWRESYMDYDKRPTTIGVDKSNKFFSCQSMTFTLRDPEYGTARGTLTMKNVELGGFLPYGYNPNSYQRVNPCNGFNGQPCSALDGVVYCGDEEYDPDRGEAPVDLIAYGERSFAEVLSALVTVPTEPNYSFRDFADRPYSILSGTWGEIVTRMRWDEYHGDPWNNLYSRDMSVEFIPVVSGSPQTEVQRANTGGYRVYRFRLVGKYGNYVTWEDTRSNMVVRSGEGYNYYACEKIQFDFPDGSTFTGEFTKFAGFLPVDYGFGKLNPYNPCVYHNYPGTCRAANGVVFCGGVQLPPEEDTPGPPVTTPTPAPTSQPTVPGGPGIQWIGSGAFKMAKNVEATLVYGADYTFVEMPNSGATSTDNGRYVQREWTEQPNRERAMMFHAYPRDSSTTKPLTLSEVKMRDNNKNWIWWLNEQGQFYDNKNGAQNMIVIPPSYDVFYCDYASFTFRQYNGGPTPLGKYVAEQFTYGNYLSGGSVDSLRYFNPCDALPNKAAYGCYEGVQCTCRVVDAQVSCNGIEVNFNALYGGMFPPGAGTSTDTGTPPGNGGGGTGTGVGTMSSTNRGRKAGRLVAYFAALVIVGIAWG